MEFKTVTHRIEVEDPESGNYFDFCEEISVIQVNTDLLTGEMRDVIEIYAASGRQIFNLPRSNNVRTILPKLVAHGLTVIDTAENVAAINEILFESEKNAVSAFTHGKLGFFPIDGRLAFLAHHPVGVISPLKAGSTFITPERTAPMGTLKSWIDLVKADIIGHPNMELVLRKV